MAQSSNKKTAVGPPSAKVRALRQQELQDDLSLVAELGRELAAYEDLGDLQQFILERALVLLAGRAGLVCLWDEETEELVPTAHRSSPAMAMEPHAKDLAAGLSIDFLRDHGPCVLNLPLNGGKEHVVFTVPLMNMDKLLGTLSVTDRKTSASYSQRDLTVGAILGAFCGGAIDSLRNIARLRESAGQLTQRVEQATGDLVRANAELTELKNFNENVIQSIGLGVVVFDSQLRLITMNRAAVDLLARRDRVDECIIAGSVESGYENWTAVLTGVIKEARSISFEKVSYQNPDEEGGPQRLISLIGAPLTDSDGTEVIGGILTVEDVTAKVTMEQRLAVSERLAAVGKLAAKVAHELNNPLDGILRYINLAMRVVGEDGDERAVRYLDECRKGLMRMVQIISELLEFSRSTYSAYETADINKVVEDAVKAMAVTAGRASVKVVTDYAPDMPTIRGGNLFQVFCNMIKNAADAIEGGGTLYIKTRLDDRELSVEFRDTGQGLPADHMSQIFQPFFTTKENGKGTGLGLAVCKDIVEKYNGRIEASNVEGGGARFLVRLPLESCRV